MQVDYLLVGQGICGSFLSYELARAGKSFIVIDEEKTNTASRIASGVINPVTGRRIVTTWMIDELMPFAWAAYTSIGAQLNIDCISERPIIDCFATPQMRAAFIERYDANPQYLSLPANENDWLPFLQYELGYGIIQPAYLVDMQQLLTTQRNALINQGTLLEARFNAKALVFNNDHIRYEHITASKIIFCEGAAAYDNPFFPMLPYGLNKGEMLLVEIPGLPATHIIKKGYSLVPWAPGIFWLGSTYLWEFENDQPTEGFYRFAENWLKQTLKMPFKIIDHRAAVRPATLERKPFVGLHPANDKLGILNGMGTKGCSLAPYFARQLVDHLLHNTPIMADANVQRFRKVLSR
ncbi:MAG TPA: FAD-dependent oxidoreductase [Chitinophagaceae bacterium]|nr:FAD-dependent oxidoreductase [Chitinophagaceae bacterium]